MNADSELEAMGMIAKTLAALDPAATSRVLRWAIDRFRPKQQDMASEPAMASQATGDGNDSGNDVATFFDSANPKTSSDRALAIAYWIQIKNGKPDFGAQEVNTALKHIGHGIGNITDVLSSLMKTTPRLVIQKQKMGNSKQARKRYMVTSEGKKYVEQLISSKESLL